MTSKILLMWWRLLIDANHMPFFPFRSQIIQKDPQYQTNREQGISFVNRPAKCTVIPTEYINLHQRPPLRPEAQCEGPAPSPDLDLGNCFFGRAEGSTCFKESWVCKSDPKSHIQQDAWPAACSAHTPKNNKQNRRYKKARDGPCIVFSIKWPQP